MIHNSTNLILDIFIFGKHIWLNWQPAVRSLSNPGQTRVPQQNIYLRAGVYFVYECHKHRALRQCRAITSLTIIDIQLISCIEPELSICQMYKWHSRNCLSLF